MNVKTVNNSLNQEFVVWVNPARDDFPMLGDVVRFTADNRTKTVYVWPFSSGHHSDVSRGLKLKDSYSCPEVLRGAAQKKGSQYQFVASDFLASFRKNPGEDDRQFLIQMLSKDWSWVNEYVVVTPHLGKLKRAFDLGQKVFIYN
jgi:hypothetical protein